MQYIYYVKKLNLNFENSYVPFVKIIIFLVEKGTLCQMAHFSLQLIVLIVVEPYSSQS